MSETNGPSDEPDVSVIVVTWNSSRWIGACLDALPAACEGLEWETIVVDNASGDASAGIAEERAGEYGRVIRSDENLGFAGGVNRGVENAKGRSLLLLNPDCILDPRSVARLIAAAETDPSVAGAAPRLRDGCGSSQDSFQFRRLPTLGAFMAELLFVDKLAPWSASTARYRYRDRDFEHGGDVEQPAFAALLLRTRVVRREGALDEQFHPAWFEDVDYCRRLRGDGFHFVVVPDVSGVHAGGASLETLHRSGFEAVWYRNMYRYATKWFSPRSVRRLRWGILVGMLIRIVATSVGFGSYGKDRRKVLRGWIEILKAAWTKWETDTRSS